MSPPAPLPFPSPGNSKSTDWTRVPLIKGFKFISILGAGAYGVVYCAKDTRNGRISAIKALSKAGLDRRQLDFQKREICLHTIAGQHPAILSIESTLETADYTFLVLEYCPDGDLFHSITERGYFVGNDDLAKRVFLQILDAVKHCHSKGVFHRDLKPENILVADNGTQIRLADFGLATLDTKSSDFGCGSKYYMSPECLRPSMPGASCYDSANNDVWSLGVILVNLTCGRNPWKRASVKDSTFNAYVQGKISLYSILPLSLELGAILQRVFEIDPKKRVSIHELQSMIAHCQQFTIPLAPFSGMIQATSSSGSGFEW